MTALLTIRYPSPCCFSIQPAFPFNDSIRYPRDQEKERAARSNVEALSESLLTSMQGSMRATIFQSHFSVFYLSFLFLFLELLAMEL